MSEAAPEKKSKQVAKVVGQAVTWPFRFFRGFCAVVGFITIMIVAAAGLYVYGFLRGLPNLDRMQFAGVKKMAQTTVTERLEDRSRRYRWISIDEVSRDLLHSVVLAEDAEFFEHEGVALDALLNSLADNIKRRKIESGGSTITQQTVKNVFLSNERTVTRKLKELLISRDIEAKLTKNEILEVYLNIAEFGPDIIGVNAASHKYFQKTPNEINAAEGAFLALLLPSPRRLHYSVVENKNLTRAHRNKIRRILGDMLHNEYISLKQYQDYLKYDYFDSAKNTPLKKRGNLQRGLAGKRSAKE